MDDLTHLSAGFLSAVHFCSARDRRWINPHVFTESLALQLAARYPAYAKALIEKSGDGQVQIMVTQRTGDVSGQVAGVVIERLALSGTLAEDAFIRVIREPLEVLCREDVETRVVIVVDALDETLLYSGEVGIVSLLARADELPGNVRFLLTSRPDERVENELVNFDRLFLSAPEYDGLNQQDIRSYVASQVAHNTGLIGMVTGLTPTEIATLVQTITGKGQGNFQYVTFLLESIAKGQQPIDELEGLPDEFDGLYLDSLKRVVELGKRDWKRDYAPLMGVLSIAQESLSLAQLEAFTGQPKSAVWRHIGDLQQFLEEVGVEVQQGVLEDRYHLYHQSMSDFFSKPQLTINGKRRRNTYYLPVEEQHQRIVNHYRGEATSWKKVVWSQVDDYGLLHLAEHLLATSPGATTELVELVDANVRLTMRQRFGTDLYFKQLVDIAIENVRTWTDMEPSFYALIFLTLIRPLLRQGDPQLPPAVLALMARLGDANQALTFIELMEPSQRRFVSLCAVLDQIESTRAKEMGTAVGIDRVVAYALEVYEAHPGMGYIFRNNCIREAAARLAPHDLQRALQLVTMIKGPGWTQQDRDKDQDTVYHVAALAADSMEQAIAIAEEMTTGVADVYLDIVDKHASTMDKEIHRCLRRAAAAIEQAPPGQQLVLLARLASAAAHIDMELMRTSTVKLRAFGLDDQSRRWAMEKWDWPRHLIDAAEHVYDVDPELAASLLDVVARTHVTNLTNWAHIRVAELWADWGLHDRCHATIEAVLAHERATNVYRSAGNLAHLAVVLSRIDPLRGRELADEAIVLIEPHVGAVDSFEVNQIDNVLGDMVNAFLDGDLELALKVAGWLTGDLWTTGGNALDTDNRLSAFAVIGLRLASQNPERAKQLLDICVNSSKRSILLGREEADVTRGGLYRPVRDGFTAHGNLHREGNFLSYYTNVVNYWSHGRSWRLFNTPVEVVRSIEAGPIPPGTHFSWASAVAEMIGHIAHSDVQMAKSMVDWLQDPVERSIALASIAHALATVDETALDGVLNQLRETIAVIPTYEPEFDFIQHPLGPIAMYYDPSVRAKFEAAIRLPHQAVELAEQLADETGSWYLYDTHRTEMLIRYTLSTLAEDMTHERRATFRRRVVEEIAQHLDEVQTSLVLSYVAAVLAHHDPKLAADVAAQITEPVSAARAKIDIAFARSGDVHQYVNECKAILDYSITKLDAQHAAAIATHAGARVANLDKPAADTFVMEGLRRVQDASNPWAAALALITIAWSSNPDDASRLAREALQYIQQIWDANIYIATDILADLFPLVIALKDVALLADVLLQIMEAGWETLVASFERSAGLLVVA